MIIPLLTITAGFFISIFGLYIDDKSTVILGLSMTVTMSLCWWIWITRELIYTMKYLDKASLVVKKVKEDIFYIKQIIEDKNFLIKK